jgi:ubiquinone/menaquinone biosynthesis C-methylase UbiE
MKELHRLYNDLAWLWPLWGSVKEYEKESDQAVKLIKQHAKIEVKNILDITCGGGKNAFNVKKHMEVYGSDMSPAMLANARKINSECTFFSGRYEGFRSETAVRFYLPQRRDHIYYKTR